jgi:hypothetical protein
MAFSPAPLNVDDVLDKTWLSAALSTGREPVRVAGFRVVETLGPSALKIRMVLEFEGAPPPDVPAEICIKGIFDPKLTAWLASGAQQTEAFFYRSCAPSLSVRVPRALYTGFDPETMGGLVIMEDLIPKGVHFLSAMSPYTPEQARQSLDQLARLHGGTWRADAARDPWVTPKLASLSAAEPVPRARLTELLLGERGEALPAAIRDGERIYAALDALARRHDPADYCFIHGDSHGGNVWEGPDGVGLIDWQVLQRGHWSIDVAYHMAAALDVEDRRRSERELLTHYLDCLARHGGTPPDPETAWGQYLAAAPYGFFMWGITLRVDPPIIRRFVTRLGLAVADHGSFELLGV